MVVATVPVIVVDHQVSSVKQAVPDLPQQALVVATHTCQRTDLGQARAGSLGRMVQPAVLGPRLRRRRQLKSDDQLLQLSIYVFFCCKQELP